MAITSVQWPYARIVIWTDGDPADEAPALS